MSEHRGTRRRDGGGGFAFQYAEHFVGVMMLGSGINF